MSIIDNITARDRYTLVLVGPAFDTPPYGTQARTAAEALFGWVYKKPGMATYEDCAGILSRVWVERGSEEAGVLLARFGCTKLSDLFMGMYEEFYRYASVVLFYGVSPQWGWTGKHDIPHDKRDRWLLYHPESDCLWEVRGKLAESEFADGMTEDVSGEREHEERWVRQQSGEVAQQSSQADAEEEL